ncbi:MAG: hypothetical protein BWY74_00280 [Firmicutes bacterium ADurb.Bin419]|nr:MAG: hypothetical protein BWY74_00280 [Firmicutes bacterium ADurb.Bin419]
MLFICGAFAIYSLIEIQTRYRYFTMPSFFILSGFGVYKAIELFGKSFLPKCKLLNNLQIQRVIRYCKFKKEYGKRKSIIICILPLLLLLGWGVLKTPLPKTSFAIQAKSTTKQCLLVISRFIQSRIRSIDDGELVLTSSNDSEFQIYNLLSNKNLLITKFDKKEWGTWNILGWSLSKDGAIPSKYSEDIAVGDTDWEYVFRVKTKPQDGCIFSGGNHGREVLKSFKLINSDDGSQIYLGENNEVKLRQLKIEEETLLTLDGKETSQYALVKRIYLIEPSKIELETNFEFTSDVFMGASYVCMFPISKTYGKNILFTNSGNIYSTPDSGQTLTTDSFNNFLGKEEATSVEIWGDKKPFYKFEVSIRNKEMVDNFSNELKTFYWDLNQDGNKLYFSKFDSENCMKVCRGTKWKNNAVWKLIVNEIEY